MKSLDFFKHNHPAFAQVEILPIIPEEDEAEQAESDLNDDDDEKIAEQCSVSLNTSLQPEDFVQYVSDNYEDLVFNVAPGEGEKPISIFGRECDAFPVFFPDGKNSFLHERKIKVGFSQYAKARLFSADAKFAQNSEYVFYLQYHKEFKEILQSASISMRKGRGSTTEGTSFTVNDICNCNNFQNLSRSNEGYKYLQAVRGSAPHWTRIMRELCATVRQLGIPTWFASFSAADRRWPEIIQAIFGQQGKPFPENMDWKSHCDAINSNPVTAALMFDHRVKCFMKHLLLSEVNPIGKIKDHFIRVEFQQRGWPHIHCLFWIEDAPQLDRESDEDIVRFTDQYVSCSQPDINEKQELYDIVTVVQMHSKSHSKTCKKGHKKCRFNFPRPPSCRTFICRPSTCPEMLIEAEWEKKAQLTLQTIWEHIDKDDYSSTEDFEAANVTQEQFEEAMCALASKTSIILKRNPQDCWVNQYNEHILCAWNAKLTYNMLLMHIHAYGILYLI